MHGCKIHIQEAYPQTTATPALQARAECSAHAASVEISIASTGLCSPFPDVCHLTGEHRGNPIN